MAYVGRQPLAGEVIILDSIESQFNGSLTSFSLTRTLNGNQTAFYPKNSGQLLVSLGGVIQKPDTTGNEGFKVNYDEIVFAVAPTNGTACFIISYGNVLDIGGGLYNATVTAGTGLSGGGTITQSVSSATLRLDIAEASDPSSGNTEGDLIFNTTDDKLKVYDGTQWKKVGGGAGESLDTVSEEVRYYIPTATLSTTGTIEETTTNPTQFFTPASTVTIADTVVITVADGNTLTIGEEQPEQQPLIVRADGVGIYRPSMNTALTIRSDFTKSNLSGYVTPRINFQGPRGSSGAITQYATILARGSGLLDPSEPNDGHLEFYTRQNNDLTKQSTLHRNGDLELHNGGLKFPNTSTYSSTSQDTLSRFEEGFWQPYWSDSVSGANNLEVDYVSLDNIGLDANSQRTYGSYTRIGNLVHAIFDMYHSGFTTTGSTSNPLYIRGWPFPFGTGDFGTSWPRAVIRASFAFQSYADHEIVGWGNKETDTYVMTRSTGSSETSMFVSDLYNGTSRITGWIMYHTND